MLIIVTMNIKTSHLNFIKGFAACATISFLTGCGSTSASEPVTRQSFYFDTICQITIYDMEDFTTDKAGSVIADTFALCSEYESILSKTREGSDVWNINHADGAPVTCDPRTVQVIEKSLDYSALTDGKFDITIGPVQDLWDFHTESPTLPDPGDVKDAISHIDYHQVQIKGDTVQLTDPDASIDLGGIAKGYIADAVTDYLKEQSVTSAVVSLGGNIACVGEKPAAGTSSLFASKQTKQNAHTPFSIGIEVPFSDRTRILDETLSLADATAVTSGVYERYFTVDGKNYHHILDPATGYPADTDVVSVTITGPEGHSADCDALSTTCLLYGVEDGLALINSLDQYEALFIDADGNITQTGGVPISK